MKLNLRIILLAAALSLPVNLAAPYNAEAAQQKKTQYQLKQKTAKKSVKSTKTAKKSPPAPQASRFSALVVNADNGHILYEKNAGSPRFPASLTKMMTLYMTFDAMKKGKLKMDDTLAVSEKAAGQPQTNISLDSGDRLPVKTAIESLIVRSANDASVALAEHLGGSVWNFSLMMNQKARALGMKNTVFRNPNGLPDPQQTTTAYDMAKLGIALRRDFPQYYPMFKITSFTWNGVTYPGHNHVMAKYAGVDGIKTGYIRASGFNLVTSVKKNGYNLVAVVMGGSSVAARDNEMMEMLDRTFAQLENNKQKALSKSEIEPESETGTELASQSAGSHHIARAF